jgi:hypothetical protein
MPPNALNQCCLRNGGKRRSLSVVIEAKERSAETNGHVRFPTHTPVLRLNEKFLGSSPTSVGGQSCYFHRAPLTSGLLRLVRSNVFWKCQSFVGRI